MIENSRQIESIFYVLTNWPSLLEMMLISLFSSFLFENQVCLLKKPDWKFLSAQVILQLFAFLAFYEFFTI